MEPQFSPAPNAALPCIAYQQYHSGTEDPHGDDCIPLSGYKLIKNMLIPTDFVDEEDGFLIFPGEFDPTVDFNLATDECKKIVRTLLKAVRRNERRGVCLSDFDEKKVVVNPYGKAKIKGVKVIRNLSQDALEAQLKRNYHSIRLIIIGLFPAGKIPEDFAHLLDLMENRFEDRELYHIHASLTPMATYSALFKDLYDHLTSVLPKDQMRDIFTELRNQLPEYLLTWKKQVLGNFLLKATFDRNTSGYEVPADKVTLDKITQQPKPQIRIYKDQIRALNSVGFTLHKIRVH